MREIAVRAGVGICLAWAWMLSACSSGLDNGLDAIPLVQITESERVALTAGAVGSTGLTLTDDSSGAAVNIPAGTVITLDASASDDVPAEVPASLVVVLRPISQFLAAQNGDLLTSDGLNLPDLTKVGGLAVLPVIGRTSADISVTIPVAESAAGELTVWRFVPDDLRNGDGELVALPNVGHWRFVDTATATSGRVTINTNSFGQYLVTTLADTGGGGTAPDVSLIANPTSGDSPLEVTFTATATDDGTIVKYEWDFENDGTIDTETTAGTTTHTYSADGQFEAEVIVTDDDGETGSATVSIGVGNAAPVITALNPLAATTNVELTLTVTASDPDGTIANYKWDLNNDDTFEVDSGAAPNTLATFPTAGTQTIGVQVADDEGAVTEQTFDIVVTDGTAAPTATLAADPESGVLDENSELAVAFTVTLDPDTTAVTSVVYDFGDGSAPVTLTESPLTTTHTYTTADTYTVTASITPQGGGANIIATTTVTVLPEGTVVATLTATPDEGELVAGELEVAFVTTLTPDTATVESAIYDFDDGSAPVTITDTPLAASHTYTAAGTYEVTVTLTPTGAGDPIVDTTTVTVTAESGGENQDPVAILNATPIDGNPRGFNLDASDSTDPDGDELTFAWDWNNDGTADSFDESTTVIYPESADDTPQAIVLTVTDSAGNEVTAQRIVTPTAPAT